MAPNEFDCGSYYLWCPFSNTAIIGHDLIIVHWRWVFLDLGIPMGTPSYSQERVNAERSRCVLKTIWLSSLTAHQPLPRILADMTVTPYIQWVDALQIRENSYILSSDHPCPLRLENRLYMTPEVLLSRLTSEPGTSHTENVSNDRCMVSWFTHCLQWQWSLTVSIGMLIRDILGMKHYLSQSKDLKFSPIKRSRSNATIFGHHVQIHMPSIRSTDPNILLPWRCLYPRGSVPIGETAWHSVECSSVAISVYCGRTARVVQSLSAHRFAGSLGGTLRRLRATRREQSPLKAYMTIRGTVVCDGLLAAGWPNQDFGLRVGFGGVFTEYCTAKMRSAKALFAEVLPNSALPGLIF